ncbi:MAG: indolepyruvate ferredoxin oxidoreductase family protein, partial [Alphaproteobacteria bacterium]|nr:indolepyruvate ferredoxin oxidoreductase family protein [Alphaproteobacteria bacterium]
MLRQVTLEDKYTEKSGRIYLNGLQALVRIPIMQRQLDAAAGLNTATFISGYRGSPLGGLDMALQSAQKYLDENHIKFVPGINEDLGATAVWGSQQLNLGPGAQYDGVVGIWYGKGPGVDRSIDALKHANAAGSSKHGGVLALAGDDHACKSSTFPHQSEQAFVHAMIPVLNPAGIADALELGLHGIAMSRYSGCWTAMKVISDFADSSASVFSDPSALQFKTPADFNMPPEGLNIRWYDPPVAQEERLVTLKLPAAAAYARANGLDKFVINPNKKRIAVVATGKAFMDTMQALEDLGITKSRA